MSHFANQLVREENGVLTFEWILLITVLVIGIVGALSSVRDAYNDELCSVACAITSLDLSYTINHPIMVTITQENSIKDHWSATAYGSEYIQKIATVKEHRPEWNLKPVIRAAGRKPGDFVKAWTVKHSEYTETAQEGGERSVAPANPLGGTTTDP